MKTLEEHKRQWEDAKAGLVAAYSALNLVDKESPYAKHAQDFAQQLHDMIQQAWLADAPSFVKKPEVKKASRRTGRPKVGYIDDELACKRLVDVIAHIIETRFEGGRMLLDNGDSVAPSQFFACVYSSVYEHGISKANNLKEFVKLMRSAVESIDMADDFTLKYDAIYDQTKKWNALSSTSRPYDFVHIYALASSCVRDDEKSRLEYQYWRSIYEAVDGILLDEGLYG